MKATHDIEKSVRIVITSGLVNQERFSKGLRESLEPRLRAVRALLPSATKASSLTASENGAFWPATAWRWEQCAELSFEWSSVQRKESDLARPE